MAYSETAENWREILKAEEKGNYYTPRGIVT